MRSRGRLARDHVRQLPDVSPGDARPVPRAIALGAIQEGHERGSEAVSSSTRRPPSASGQCGADAGTRPARMGAGGYRGTVARARPPVSGSDGGAIGDAADRHGVRSRDRRLTDRRGHGRDQEFCHLRLRHNLEGPETVITPRLSDELCPVGAPALGQDQRGQAVLVGHVPERACPASSGRVLAPRTIPIRHRQRFLVRIIVLRDGTPCHWRAGWTRPARSAPTPRRECRSAAACRAQAE